MSSTTLHEYHFSMQTAKFIQLTSIKKKKLNRTINNNNQQIVLLISLKLSDGIVVSYAALKAKWCQLLWVSLPFLDFLKCCLTIIILNGKSVLQES